MMISTLGNTLLPPSVLSQQQQPLKLKNKLGNKNGFFISCCSNNDISSTPPTTATSTSTISETPTPLVRRRKRYRKMYPGESTGVVEEMRFVAMKLRNDKPNIKIHKGEEDSITEEGVSPESSFEDSSDGVEETWQPSIEGFLKYLVDSKLVFETVERVVDESDNVAYSYFRKTGLERSGSILKDLEWFQEQDLTIPQPSSLGVSYAQYLKELAEKSPPLFLSHFYNIYFAHMSGGQVIAEKVYFLN
ncbi:hypothetical protein GIB67_016167 [Kingdonia uniflora]|uniref:Inactive heme oxygenase 2, chloroplastic n=1 Tax=Kingdonia uniflora TaxID=39325 RepID=A0A7J7N9J9_9MAGN|nr:hypothetical protein GIB67_016167 [Kingdonia uniflora]